VSCLDCRNMGLCRIFKDFMAVLSALEVEVDTCFKGDDPYEMFREVFLNLLAAHCKNLKHD